MSPVVIGNATLYCCRCEDVLAAGHQFVGVEIEAEYFDTACERIELAQRQSAMFPHEEQRSPEQLGIDACP